MKILVTGAAGFTGGHFSSIAREAGYDVYALQADLTDATAVTEEVLQVKPDYVVHFAAISFVAHGDADAIYRVNIVGTHHLLHALSLLSTPPKAVLLPSSSNVYGQAEKEILDETTALLPANDYGVSKLAMEHMARLWMGKLPIIITRPFNYTGLNQHPNFLIPKIVGHFIRKEATIELGNLDVERDYSDVRVVCDGYLKLLLTPEAIGQTVNVCSGVAYSLREIISTMENIAGYKINVQVNPKFVRANEIKRLVGSNKKLHEVIGMQTYPPIEETVRWMYEGS